MRVLILGAGAMGSLLGARLSRTDAAVMLLGTNREHLHAMRRDGLTIEELDGSLSRHSLACFDNPLDAPRKADLIIVLVKGYATGQAVESIRAFCSPSTIFLTLQNGIGNWESIARLVGTQSVLVGTTAQGATLLGPGRIRHGGNGPTYVGEVGGPASERTHAVVDLLRQAGMEASASDRMERLIWEKLVVNVGINAITALTGIRNGMVEELEDARRLSLDAVREALAVAAAKGIALDADMEGRVVAVARATAVNRSSMGQDVDRRKRTEVDSINGAIVRLGEEAGIAVPVNRTLTRLIKVLEAGYSRG